MSRARFVLMASVASALLGRAEAVCEVTPDGIGEVIIPPGVTRINSSAFSGCLELRTVIFPLPSVVTVIGNNAFTLSGLTSIRIPDGVTSIQSAAFFGAANLTQVTLPSALTFLGPQILQNTGIRTVRIPDLVTIINSGALEGTSRLETVVISDSVTTVSTDAFRDSGLLFVVVPDGVTSIESGAFRGCARLENIVLGTAVGTIRAGAFFSNPALEWVLMRFPTTTSIALSSATPNFPSCLGFGLRFSSLNNPRGNVTCLPCAGRQTLTVPDTVTLIAESALNSCPSVNRIVVPDSVTGLASNNFFGFPALEAVVLPSALSVTPSSNSFPNCVGYGLRVALTAQNLPVGNVTCVPCAEVTTLQLSGNSITRIGAEAFKNCDSITSVVLPDTLVSIGVNAFFGTTNLRNATFPQSLSILEHQAFERSGLEVVRLPEGLTMAVTQTNVFRLCPNLLTVVLPNSVSRIPQACFRGCTRLRSLTLPAGLIQIDSEAFQGCTALDSLPLPSSVVSIGRASFLGCSALRTATLPAGVAIRVNAFTGCGCLETEFVPGARFCDCGSCAPSSPSSSSAPIGSGSVTNPPLGVGVPTPVTTGAPSISQVPSTAPTTTPTAPTVSLPTTTPARPPSDAPTRVPTRLPTTAVRTGGDDGDGGEGGATTAIIVAVVVTTIMVVGCLAFCVTILVPAYRRRRAADKVAKYRDGSSNPVNATVAAGLQAAPAAQKHRSQMVTNPTFGSSTTSSAAAAGNSPEYKQFLSPPADYQRFLDNKGERGGAERYAVPAAREPLVPDNRVTPRGRGGGIPAAPSNQVQLGEDKYVAGPADRTHPGAQARLYAVAQESSGADASV